MARKDRESHSGNGHSPHLTSREQGQAEEHASPRAVVIHEIIREDGELELKRTTASLALSGLAGGLSMGFSFLTQALLHAAMPPAPWRHAVDSFGYCMGFILVVLGRHQLFTESTLTAVLPVITRHTGKVLLDGLRLWGVVLAANLIGTWLFAALLTVRAVFAPEVTPALQELSRQVLQSDFTATFLKAVLAGWLIALMVWILPSARSARLMTIVLVTYVVGLGQLSHIVASSAEAAYAVFSGFASAGDYFGRFLAPTLLGNIVGGVALVSLLNHGSVRQEMKGQDGGA